MKGWRNEPNRHSLASRGIKSRAIPNPVASLRWSDSYTRGSQKGLRRFKGSGLENVNTDDIIDYIMKFRDFINEISENEELNYDFQINSIYIVGSRVGGFHRKKSDLDVIVYLNDDPRRFDLDFKNEVQDLIVVAKQWIVKEFNPISKETLKPRIRTMDGNYIDMDIKWDWMDSSLYGEDGLYEPYIKIYDRWEK